MPEHEIQKVECADFILPPRGTSEEKDFDLLCHLEVEPEKEDKKGGKDEDEEVEEEENALDTVVKYKSVVPNIQDYWLRMKPDADDYIDVVVRGFNQGLDQI